MERLLDEPVELGREAPVEPHVLAEEEEVRGPLVDSIGELAAALGDETLEPAEPPAACRSGFRLGFWRRLGLRLRRGRRVRAAST